MLKKVKFKLAAKVLFAVLVASAIAAFLHYRYEALACQRIKIQIDHQVGNYFLNEDDLLQLLTNNGEDYLIGQKFKNINTKKLELRVKNHKFVKDCQVYRSFRGDLVVEVAQIAPIARFVRKQARDFYIDAQGGIIPVSERFTARVLLLTADKAQEIPNFDIDSYDKKLLALANFIAQDEFWRAQITQVHIHHQGELSLYSHLGEQEILFGQPDNLEEKFRKLKIVYETIFPQKGWSTYKKVNLKYHRQIICE
jgi:cell division protein FtsQ